MASAVLVLGTALILPPFAPAFTDAAPTLKSQAEQWERRGQWAKASQLWEQALARDRTDPQAREGFQRSLRRAQQVRRFQDPTYARQAKALALSECLDVYGEVLSRLKSEYVDSEKVDLGLLFRQGLLELKSALDADAFRRQHLKDARNEAVAAFQGRLDNDWIDSSFRRVEDVLTQAQEVALAASRALGLSPTLAVLEFACGACNALDEYTYYLTPGQFKELNAAWKGEAVGVGLELSVDSQGHLYIAGVVTGSPAQQKGLKPTDRILRIGGESTAKMAAESAVELLKGEADSTIELEVLAYGEARPRVVKLKREFIHVPSVSRPKFLDLQARIGYLRVHAFQETTIQELDLAIAELQAKGMRVLLLDLRGNQGGLFEVARQVVERFLSAGIIVSTQGPLSEYNATYYSQSMNPLTIPLVVLVDGVTASSAEMVAGALKDNQRGRLVGKTTFGKGSIQKVRKLQSAAAAIRITVARFYSPRGLPLDRAGVAPDLEVAGPDAPVEPEQDPQVKAALEVALPLAMDR